LIIVSYRVWLPLRFSSSVAGHTFSEDGDVAVCLPIQCSAYRDHLSDMHCFNFELDPDMSMCAFGARLFFWNVMRTARAVKSKPSQQKEQEQHSAQQCFANLSQAGNG